MAADTSIQDSIVASAEANGVDPDWALWVAKRESDYNPNAHASKTIHGLFQMSKPLRDKYGVGDSNDPTVQSNGFMNFAKDLKAEMTRDLGREPTNDELYAGHYFGPHRAARMVSGEIDPNTPVNTVFTNQEMQGNPNFAKAGTVGNLLGSIKMGGATTKVASAAPQGGSFGPSVGASNLDYGSYGSDLQPASPMGSLQGISSDIAKTNAKLAQQQSQKAAEQDTSPPFAPINPPDSNQKLAEIIKQVMQPQQQGGMGGLPPLPTLAKPSGLGNAVAPQGRTY